MCCLNRNDARVYILNVLLIKRNDAKVYELNLFFEQE